jgi:oxygen-independent coproporphyrinogen-3 oxidase
LWRPDCLAAVVDAVQQRLGLASDAEVTVECNPGEVDSAWLVGARAAGVNRISLGCQSFDARWLAILGRTHDAATSASAVEALHRAGFSRFSIDVMHGMAGQTVEAACADVQRAIDLGARHVSTYQLTIESQTAFGARARRGERLLGDEEALLAMFTGVRETLRAGGLTPYEVSSAAAPGHRAVHNQLYWTDGEYLALGVGAHGYRHTSDGGALRWSNPPKIETWLAGLAGGSAQHASVDRVDADDRLADRVMCGLRMDDGVAIDASIQARFGAAAERLARDGLLTCTSRRWAATDRGRLLLDHLTLRLLTDHGQP